MPYTYRPDLLPFALPTRIGLPFHGLVTNGKLALPGGGTKTYTQPDYDGSTWKVANAAKANTRTRTPEEIANDTAQGYVWQAHALISGGDKLLGGVSIGVSNWPVVDDAGNVWLVGIDLDKTDYLSGRFTISVVLRKRFGVLGASVPAAINRVLATRVHTVDLEAFPYDDLADYFAAGGPPAFSIISGTYLSGPPHARYLDFTEDGRLACWNMATVAGFSSVGYDGNLFGWAEIALSGTGSTVTDTLGDGIVATLVTRGLSDVLIALETNDDEPSILDHPYPEADITTVAVEPEAPAAPICPISPDPSAKVKTNIYTTTAEVIEPPVSWTWTGLEVEYIVYRYADGDVVKYRGYSGSSYYATTDWSGSTVVVFDFFDSCYDALGGRLRSGSPARRFDLPNCGSSSLSLKAEWTSEYIRTKREELTIGGTTFAMEAVSRTSGWVTEERTDGDLGVGTWCGMAWGARTNGGETVSTITITPSGLTEDTADDTYAGVSYGQNSNQVWGVKASTHTLARFYAATTQGYEDITSEWPDNSFNASLNPATGEIAWSPTDKVCWV
jgi:hypothetical protein